MAAVCWSGGAGAGGAAGVVAFEQRLGEGGGAFAHGHRLHRQHVAGAQLGCGCGVVAGSQIAVEIGDAVAIAGALARQGEAAQFTAGQIGRAHV